MPKERAQSSIEERLDWLRERNQSFSETFISPSVANMRYFYESEHPTRIMAFKCMDGRIHLPVMANMPLGSIRPMRSLGGYFDLGWPYLGLLVRRWININLKEARRSLVLITYHYSKGEEHRGCAGFCYDSGAAYKFTQDFLEQFIDIFGKSEAVYPIILGIETDEESFVFHNGDKRLSVKDYLEADEAKIKKALFDLYPDLHLQMLNDLLPMIIGNVNHVKSVRQSNRPVIESEHLEWVIGLGRGFDWLHEPNLALIIGPYNPDMSSPLRKAFGIIQDNLKKGKFSDDGFVMLSSGLYNDPIGLDMSVDALGSDKMMAREKALFLRDFSDRVAEEYFPDLHKIMHHVTVIVDYNTRRMEEIQPLKNFRLPF